jgi:putative ABC transport system substrate-binding protein
MIAAMRRREFITLLGGAAVAWSLAARAQQPVIPVIGYLHSGSSAPYARLVAAFRQSLKEAIEYRWAEGRYDGRYKIAATATHERYAR